MTDTDDSEDTDQRDSVDDVPEYDAQVVFKGNFDDN